MGSARGNRDRMEGNENMKKIIKAGICVAAAAMIMTGCGNKNQNAESSSAAVEETASAQLRLRQNPRKNFTTRRASLSEITRT